MIEWRKKVGYNGGADDEVKKKLNERIEEYILYLPLRAIALHTITLKYITLDGTQIKFSTRKTKFISREVEEECRENVK